MGWLRAETDFGMVAFDAEVGNIRELSFNSGGRWISPLHTAHWVQEPRSAKIPDTLAPVERYLSGDFFCAPFGMADVVPSPPHGWSANSHWTLTQLDDGLVAMTLDRPVLGATITKRLEMSPIAPLLYQTHQIQGGTGATTVAHHPMVHVSGHARLATSPKRAALTPDMPLERDRHRLAYPARSTDLMQFPAQDGGTVDLTKLPIATGCEDFVTLVESANADLGWSAVLREPEDDIVFFLKDPNVLPVTMLWHSNGGRDYAPWDGRHTGVIGIEDGCAAGADGHRAALSPNPVSRESVATAVVLGDVTTVHHVIGAVVKPTGWTTVHDIRLAGAELVLIGDGGAEVRLPFDPDFFTETC